MILLQVFDADMRTIMENLTIHGIELFPLQFTSRNEPLVVDSARLVNTTRLTLLWCWWT
jgi:hypothetical protein